MFKTEDTNLVKVRMACHMGPIISETFHTVYACESVIRWAQMSSNSEEAKFTNGYKS